MSKESKVVKISEEAYSLVRNELSRRLSENLPRVKWKEVTSDLIVLGAEHARKTETDQKDYESLVVNYLSGNIKSSSEDDRAYSRLYAHVIYWDHVRLALTKGFTWKEAPEHVYEYLTKIEKRDQVINLLKNQLSSRYEWK